MKHTIKIVIDDGDIMHACNPPCNDIGCPNDTMANVEIAIDDCLGELFDSMPHITIKTFDCNVGKWVHDSTWGKQ